MKINGKDFKELVLWQKILALIAVPAILLSTFVIVFAVLGTTLAGVIGILAIIFVFVAIIVIISLITAVPVAIFRKIRGSVIKHEK